MSLRLLSVSLVESTWIEHSPRKDQALALAQFLDEHRNEIAPAWSALIYDHAMFHPDEMWLDGVIDSTNRALVAVSHALATDNCEELADYLRELSVTTLRSGFESSEVIKSLLLCKDAALPTIGQVYAGDITTVLTLTAALDAALRWMVGYFALVDGAEMNRKLREQHERMVTTLKLAQREPISLELDEVLRYVAEGVIATVQVNHCDFYIVSEDQRTLTPKIGIWLTPMTPAQKWVILNHFPNGETDTFLSDVLRKKEPRTCYDVQQDAGINPEFVAGVRIKSVLAVPLVIHDRVLAIAVTGTFDEYRAFTEDQIGLARDIASAAALVIENARLYEKMRYMAVLEERERLAREIHDNLAQALSLVQVQVSHLETLLKAGKIDQAQTFLVGTKRLASEAYTDARDAIYSLRHSSAMAVAFLPALQDYLNHYHSNYGLTVHLLIKDDRPIMLPNEAVIQLTRIVQEALTNVRKHAAATEILIELERVPDALRILVKDNGRGFDAAMEIEGRFGLHVMRERAETLGGTLDVQTAPGQGTTIITTIPFTSGS